MHKFHAFLTLTSSMFMIGRHSIENVWVVKCFSLFLTMKRVSAQLQPCITKISCKVFWPNLELTSLASLSKLLQHRINVILLHHPTYKSSSIAHRLVPARHWTPSLLPLSPHSLSRLTVNATDLFDLLLLYCTLPLHVTVVMSWRLWKEINKALLQ